MRRATAILILSLLLSSLVLLPDNLRAEEQQGQTATPPTAPSPTLAGAAAAGSVSATTTVAPATPVVEVDKGLLTVRAEGAELTLLLKKIGQAAGIPVDVAEGVTGKVSISFSGLALEEGINRILEAADSRNYAASFIKNEAPRPGGQTYSMQEISIVRKAAGADVRESRTAAYPKVKVRLSSGKEIEVFKGQFVVKLGERGTSSRRTVEALRSLQDKMAARIGATYGLRVLSQFERGPGDHVYIFQSDKEVDQLQLLGQLNKDRDIWHASFNGFGKDSATFDVDEKGRFHYDPEGAALADKKILSGDYDEDQKRRIIAEYQSFLFADPKRDLFTWIEGRVDIHFPLPRSPAETARQQETVMEICNDYNGIPENYLEALGGHYSLHFPKAKGDAVLSLIEVLEKDPRLKGADVGRAGWGGFLRQADPYEQHQWYLNNISAAAAWGIERGTQNVKVAMIDTGIGGDLDDPYGVHEDFLGNAPQIAYEAPVYIDDSGKKYYEPQLTTDDVGHGTHVAGIIAARSGNGVGISGLAGGAAGSGGVTMIPIRVQTKEMGQHGHPDLLAVWAAIEYAIGNGAHVINLSMGAAAKAAFQTMIERYPQHTWTKKALTKISQGEEER